MTTARITHASPAAAYAHTAYREFEAITPEFWPDRDQCPDIASQLIRNEENRKIKVKFNNEYIPVYTHLLAFLSYTQLRICNIVG